MCEFIHDVHLLCLGLGLPCKIAALSIRLEERDAARDMIVVGLRAQLEQLQSSIVENTQRKQELQVYTTFDGPKVVAYSYMQSVAVL